MKSNSYVVMKDLTDIDEKYALFFVEANERSEPSPNREIVKSELIAKSNDLEEIRRYMPYGFGFYKSNIYMEENIEEIWNKMFFRQNDILPE